MRRTKEEALLTREKLLDAAELLFADKGVARTTLHDIARAAGLTRGAIYWHFPDKAALFNAMMERTTLPLEETFRDVRQQRVEDPVARLRASLIEALTRVAEEPRTRRVFEIAMHKAEYTEELGEVRERRRQVLLARRGDLEAALRRAQKLALIKPQPSARHMAVGLLALLHGLISVWIIDPELFNLTRHGTQAIDLYLAGLQPDE